MRQFLHLLRQVNRKMTRRKRWGYRPQYVVHWLTAFAPKTGGSLAKYKNFVQRIPLHLALSLFCVSKGNRQPALLTSLPRAKKCAPTFPSPSGIQMTTLTADDDFTVAPVSGVGYKYNGGGRGVVNPPYRLRRTTGRRGLVAIYSHNNNKLPGRMCNDSKF